MVISCCVSGCNSKYIKGGRLSFYFFPKDKNLYKKWVKFVNTRRRWSGPFKNSRLCNLHFNKDDFKNFMRYSMGQTLILTLNADAVPSQYLKNSQTVKSDAAKPREKRLKRREIIKRLQEGKTYIKKGAPPSYVEPEFYPPINKKRRTNTQDEPSINKKPTPVEEESDDEYIPPMLVDSPLQDVSVIWYCNVPMCSNNSKQNPHLGFHQIPPLLEGRKLANSTNQKWKDWLHILFSLWNVKYKVVQQTISVCSIHFPEAAFICKPVEGTSGTSVKLMHDAVPALDPLYQSYKEAQQKINAKNKPETVATFAKNRDVLDQIEKNKTFQKAAKFMPGTVKVNSRLNNEVAKILPLKTIMKPSTFNTTEISELTPVSGRPIAVQKMVKLSGKLSDKVNNNNPIMFLPLQAKVPKATVMLANLKYLQSATSQQFHVPTTKVQTVPAKNTVKLNKITYGSHETVTEQSHVQTTDDDTSIASTPVVEKELQSDVQIVSVASFPCASLNSDNSVNTPKSLDLSAPAVQQSGNMQAKSADAQSVASGTPVSDTGPKESPDMALQTIVENGRCVNDRLSSCTLAVAQGKNVETSVEKPSTSTIINMPTMSSIESSDLAGKKSPACEVVILCQNESNSEKVKLKNLLVPSIIYKLGEKGRICLSNSANHVCNHRDCERWFRMRNGLNAEK